MGKMLSVRKLSSSRSLPNLFLCSNFSLLLNCMLELFRASSNQIYICIIDIKGMLACNAIDRADEIIQVAAIAFCLAKGAMFILTVLSRLL